MTETTTALPALLTEQAVAEYLGVSTRTVRRLASEDEAVPGTGLPSCRIGKSRRYTEADVLEYLARQRTPAPAPINGRAARPTPPRPRAGETAPVAGRARRTA